MYFTIAHPGRYYLAARNATPGSITDIAAGRRIVPGLLVQSLLMLAGLAALILAGLIGVITAVRRHRCSAELAGLGPPSAGLRSEYRQARQACAGFEQGARCDMAAARILNPVAAKPQPKVTRLFRCSDAGINRGSKLIAVAVSDASSRG